MTPIERIKTIAKVLQAVQVLEWHDKNFLTSERSLFTLKREFIDELVVLTKQLEEE